MTKTEKNKYWKKKYNSYKSSDLSASKWCKENGIPSSTFSKWKKLFDNDSSNNESGWVTVAMKPKPRKKINKTIKVIIGKTCIEYNDETCINTFSDVVKVLIDYV